MTRLLLLCACAVAFCLPAGANPGPASNRPSVGLVLAGGGARGIAHVGVIQALEELQIPVDAIAGTSMGALVGGLYASGMDAAELSGVVETLDWASAFEDRVDRGQLPPRRKSDDFDYPSDIQLSFKDGGVSLPLGVVQGQQVRLMIKELMQPVLEIDDFDQLPIPYRAVATDMETGDAYVFAEGDIVTAMRTSMSLPALLAPVEHEGRLLVDGGMANNIPVDVARAMGVDRVIVIDIGTPLKKREDITSILAVTNQMLGFLTRRNSLQQLDTLEEGDLLIRPDLDGIGMLDFDQDRDIQQRGYTAAMSLSVELSALAVDADSWQNYLADRSLPPQGTPVIGFVTIANDSSVTDEMIRVRVSQPIGQPLDRDRLLEDIATIYALDYWEIIDYDLVKEGDTTGLLLSARAKSWGEGELKLGLNLVTDLNGISDMNLGASYLMKELNRRGGEIYGRGQLGDTILLNGEYYQPLDLKSGFFIAPYLGYTDYQVLTLGPEYEVEELVGAWRVRNLRGELSLGANLFNDSQFRLGVFRGWGEYRIDVSATEDLPEGSFDEGGAYVSYRFDNLDSAYFPTSGALLYTDYEAHLSDLGADRNFDRWQVFGQAAFSFGGEQRNTLLFTGKLGQTWGAKNEPQNYFQLGGLFNLSGLSQNFYSGRQMGFLMAQYQRRLTDNSVIPLDMPIHMGASLEGGQLWSRRADMDIDDFVIAGSIYLAVDSPIGPVYLAYGRSEESMGAIYLSLGWPFLVGTNRLRR